ncbi:V-type ATP synthase subunit E family protein [Candidatus Albibeggiatoa sp. nov. BB20]|uniref:V-type ATP synthase subunit E n=1 Tax=Candidatus Albibeggiatoa sp. nov. BB20 TaxID=3162723 RepID=UPI00336592F7
MATTATDSQIEKLEQAILQRAQTLADSHLSSADQQRQKIVADSAKRLRRREEQATEEAKTAAEQEYHRLIQAHEIKMQSELDQVRWSLMQSAMDALREQLQKVTQQPEQYLSVLKQYLQHAAKSIEADALEVLVNQQDHDLLAAQWCDLIQECGINKPCTLSTEKPAFLGGVLVCSQDNRIQVDNTFDGIIERLLDDIYQEMNTQLFATASPIRSL